MDAPLKWIWPALIEQLRVFSGNLNDAGMMVSVPSPARREWEDFGNRWIGWRNRFDRSHWPDSWQGRAYQRRTLTFPSPWHSSDQTSTCLSLRNGLAFAYVISEGERVALLLPGFFGAGHEIEALYLIQERLLLHLPCSLATPEWFLSLVEGFLPVLDGRNLHEIADRNPPIQLRLEGHPNFAHQLLNGYTALDAALSDSGTELESVQLVGLAPFAPLEKVFPEVRWLPPWQSPEPLGTLFELPLSQRPDRINSNLRRRLRQVCRSESSPGIMNRVKQMEQWRCSGGWVLWLSLKSGLAIAEGLNDLVRVWFQLLSRRGVRLPLLVLDGFSVQSGQQGSDRIHGIKISTMIDQELQQARQIRQMLEGKRLKLPVIEAIGLPLAASVVLGEQADFYFCHQGTVQHKIGWLQQGTPGVVHSNSVRNQGFVHPWGAMGLGLPPCWFPAEFCEDLGNGPRDNYRFIHGMLDSAAQWLCDQLMRSLPELLS